VRDGQTDRHIATAYAALSTARQNSIEVSPIQKRLKTSNRTLFLKSGLEICRPISPRRTVEAAYCIGLYFVALLFLFFFLAIAVFDFNGLRLDNGST